jgi:Dolichyl-phosphate-mannose-protein mannosyltransferase
MNSTERRRDALAWALFLVGLLGVVFAHHVPEQLVLAATGAPAEFALALPPRVPLWLPWGCVLAAFLLWQTGRMPNTLMDSPSPLHPFTPSPLHPFTRSLAPVLMLALIVGLGALLRLLPLFDTTIRAASASLDYDEAVYTGAASLMRQGYWPYRDFFMAHPPLAMALLTGGLWLRDAVWLDLPTFVALRRAVALLDCLAIIGCYLTVRRIGGVAAGLLAALAYAAGGMLAAVGRAIMLEPLQSALLMFAAAAYVRCLDSHRPRTWAAMAGALVAAACLVKLTGGVLVLAFVLHLALLRRWRELGVLAAAGVLTALLLLAPFLAHAPLELPGQIMLAQLVRGQDGATPFRRGQLLMSLPDQALLAVGAALGLLRLGLAAARRRLHPGWGMLLLWGVGLWAAVGGWAAFFPHYYATLALAPACLVGAVLLPEGAPTRGWRLATAGLGLVLALALARETTTYGDVERKDDLVADTLALRASTPPDRDVLLFEPTIAILAGHNPARLPGGQFFLDTYLWWSYVDQRGGDARAQVEAMFDQAGLVILNGEDLRRIDKPLYRELAERLHHEFWYRPLAYAQLHYRVVGGDARAVFDGSIELLSAEPPRWQADPAGVQVPTYWRAAAPPAPDQALFVHLLAASGDRVAQIDLPLQGAYDWKPGEVMPLPLLLPLPAPPPDGDYRLVLGLYSFSTGKRAAIRGAGDTIELARVTCVAGQCTSSGKASP